MYPVKQRCGHVVVRHPKSCVITAALNQYFNWAILVLTTWIGLHLFILAVFKKDYKNSRKYELCIILTAVIVPIVFSIVPLFHVKYGLAGAWCWIKATDEECQKIKAGVIEQFMLWYVPVMLFAIIFFLIVIIVIIVLFIQKKAAAEQHVQDLFSRSLKEMYPILFCPVIFSTIYGLAFINRVYYAATNNAVLGLWILHSLGSPFYALIIPLAFFMSKKT